MRFPEVTVENFLHREGSLIHKSGTEKYGDEKMESESD